MTRRQRKRRNRKKSPARSSGAFRILLLLLLLPLIVAVGGLLWLWPRCTGAECPSVQALRDYAPPQASRVFGAEGEIIAHLAPERRVVVPLERIPSHVAGAFLAVEDQRFFRHDGIDYRLRRGERRSGICERVRSRKGSAPSRCSSPATCSRST